MAETGRGRKRKSDEFICEINEEDLSSDEDESLKSPSRKMSRIECETIETSKIDGTSNLVEIKSDNESVVSVLDESNDLKVTETETKDQESCSIEQECTREPNPEVNPKQPSDDNINEVIDIDESCVDLTSSVILIEENPIVMIVSDEEEGEIIEHLKVIDEVTATPLGKTLDTNTAESNNISCLLREDEFHVVEEIGRSPSPHHEENLINISFRCAKTMSQYASLFVTFLKSFPEIEVEKGDLCINVREKEFFVDTETPKKRNKKKKKVKKDLFIVDTNPSSNDDNSHLHQLRYVSKFEINEEVQTENVEVKKSASSKVCFNCDGDHALRDCSIPKNHRKINQARQQFIDKYKTVRYHVDQNQKDDRLKPGVISENLRDALGLHKNELPSYIYKMRRLGYPPGWLEEAKISPSDLSLYNIDGKKVETIKTQKSYIDTSKIIEYPGFNMPLKKGCRDEFKRHKVVPYSSKMNKSSMIQYYTEQFEKEDAADTCNDMETSLPNVCEKKSMEQMIKDEAAASSNSPSLVDLEAKKKELLVELNTNESQEKTSNDSNENTCQDSMGDQEQTREDNAVVKSSKLGTPILQSSSPYSRLPNPDNFSIGVSPVIDFENLPNSTGKYEELSKVLGKVRMTMKNIL